MKHIIKHRLKDYRQMIFGDAVTLIKKCGRNIIIFELLYKLVAIAVFYPLFIQGMNLTLRLAGFKYLTNNYFFTYIRSPFTIIFFLLLIVILAIYITYEVACLSVCFDAGYHDQPITIVSIFKAGAILMRHSMKKKKIRAVINIALISVVMNITLLGFWLSNVTIPDPAKEAISTYRYFLIPAGLLLLALFLYCLEHMFAMNYMAYDAEDITWCKKMSRSLIRRRRMKSFLVMLGWNVLIVVSIYIIYLVVILIMSTGVFILDKADIGMAIYLSSFRVIITVVKLVMTLFSLPVSYAVITGLFYRYRYDNGVPRNIGEITEKIECKKQVHPLPQIIVSIVAIVCTLALNVYYMIDAFDSNPFSKVEIFSETQIMAHRGCSYDAPENTMMAFEHAVEATADYIELDVHETSDGVIVVMHDPSLKRTTGINRYIWNVTYDEIKDVDAGSFFGDDEEYAQCRIPTLEQVMEYTKGKIKLNIEIKLSSHEPDLVDSVAELIHKYEYEEDCVVTSMNYEALKAMKQIDTNIKTGYVLTVAYGSFYNIDYVDAFSINSAYVNKNVVDAIHNRGKQIYVWTVNSRSKAKELTRMGVDALISDNPVMSREVVYSKYSNSLFYNVLSYVFDR